MIFIYKIVSLSANDAERLAELEEICFADAWSKVMFEGDLLSPHTRYYGALNDKDELVGYIGMWLSVDDGQITNVAVHPDYRKNGIASKLIDTLKCECLNNAVHSLTLEVRKSNNPAISLYKKYGFEMVGERKNYYKNPKEDAILMTFAF